MKTIHLEIENSTFELLERVAKHGQMSITQYIRFLIDKETIILQSTENHDIREQAFEKFIDCAEGDENLSLDYKQRLSIHWARKHGYC